MKNQGYLRWGRLALLVALAGGCFIVSGAPNVPAEAVHSIAQGVHLWYEIKADPEEPSNLIICGTKWDAHTNGPFGFVYASSNSGSTWHSVLEDRSSVWVTEHSCAFGPGHRAYFVSEASRVFDGEQHHDLGVTRLFVSADAGRHWTEKLETGWADHSTSAVNPETGWLYTFFNDPSGRDPGRNQGNGVGLLIFSPDGEHVAGPFFDGEMRKRNYQGVYPSDAVTLADGAISALFYAVRKTVKGSQGQLVIVRADQARRLSLTETVISRGILDANCWNAEVYAQAYDRQRNRLSILYMEGCGVIRMMLTSSGDEGRSWTKAVAVSEQKQGTMAMYPSLLAMPDGSLELLWYEWEGGTGQWLFGQIRDNRLIEPPIQLSSDRDTFEASNDSLWTTIHRPRELGSDSVETSLGAPVTVRVRGLVDVVWRSDGLLALGDKTLAIWPSSGAEGMQLNSAIFDPHGSGLRNNKSVIEQPVNPDVTQHTVITYAGEQSFDKMTGMLTVCLSLSNRGNESIRLPIELEATDIRSPGGTVSVVNATNDLGGTRAIWDVSNSVTGDRLAPGATSNPFCLSFQVRGFGPHASPLDENLVTLKVRVLSLRGRPSEPRREP